MDIVFDFVIKWAVELLLCAILISGLVMGIIASVRLGRVAHLFRQAGVTLLTNAQNVAHRQKISTDTGDPRKDALRLLRAARIREAIDGRA